jgi:4-alpha-glucanotransferase
MSYKRYGGILCHVTSLPSMDGIGNLGEASRQWIDYLAGTQSGYWQVLPMGPTGFGDSPYQVFSAFAGNPMLISLRDFIDDGYFTENELIPPYPADLNQVQYLEISQWKEKKLRILYERIKKSNDSNFLSAQKAFSLENDFWLPDFCLFMALKNRFSRHPWHMWPAEYRFRHEQALVKAREDLADEIGYQEFIQFIFHLQCQKTRLYAESKGIHMIGDIPLYVAFDSADVWANPQQYQLNRDLIPAFVAGVPPDYFSATGQRWGNPVYRWDLLEAHGFDWWIKRISHTLKYVHLIRLDHFRGLAAYYSIPSIYPTAENGEWIPAPGKQLLQAIQDRLHKLPFIAEDLGVITPDVTALRDEFNLPGMRIFQFGFGVMEENIHKPDSYVEHCVAYSGTHDNETTLGWYQLQPEEVKQQVLDYLQKTDTENLVLSCIDALWSSVAYLTMTPIQDVLQLDNEARMNLPGTVGGNWVWKLRNWEQIEPVRQTIASFNRIHHRDNSPVQTE